MAFTFENISIDEARERFATTRETMLSQFVKRITDQLSADESFEATPAVSLDYLLSQDSAAQDWQTRAQERENGQPMTVDAIVRKVNAEKDTTDIRAIRRKDNGDVKVAFVRNSLWKPEDEDAENAA